MAITEVPSNAMAHFDVAPVCSPTLQVIGLQIPCLEKVGVAFDALQLFLGLKYESRHTLS